MNPESLIFDVDGTLWDSVDLVVRGWNLALEEAGREPTCTPEGIRPLFGKTMDEIALAFLPDQGPEERRRLMNIRDEFKWNTDSCPSQGEMKAAGSRSMGRWSGRSLRVKKSLKLEKDCFSQPVRSIPYRRTNPAMWIRER